MRWFDTIYKTSKLSVSWEYSTTGSLWRLLPSGAGLFLGEDRDIEGKFVSFFCIDQTTGAVRWSGLRLDEAWWIGMEAIHRDYLLLHEFASPSMPDHKKIHGVDINTGRKVWSNNEYQFLFAHEDSIYGVKDSYEERHFFELELATGKVRNEIEPSYLDVLRETTGAKSDPAQFPEVINPEGGDPRMELLRDAAGKVTFTGDLEFIDMGRHIVFAYYEVSGVPQVPQNLEQHLVVYDRERESVVYREVMNKRIKSPVPDLFFRIGEYLYFIADRKRLKAVHLVRQS